MGWSFESTINLFSALRTGVIGIIIVAIYYITMLPILLLTEKYILKTDGVAAIAMSSIAGMSVSVPALVYTATSEYSTILESATAQIVFGVVITSLLTPIILKWWDNKNLNS